MVHSSSRSTIVFITQKNMLWSKMVQSKERLKANRKEIDHVTISLFFVNNTLGILVFQKFTLSFLEREIKMATCSMEHMILKYISAKEL